jgi:hypothetical protein
MLPQAKGPRRTGPVKKRGVAAVPGDNGQKPCTMTEFSVKRRLRVLDGGFDGQGKLGGAGRALPAAGNAF